MAAAILALATLTITAALVSQYVFGLPPCKLCLEQRWPYYLGVPLAFATAMAPRGGARRVGFVLLAIVFLVSAGMGLRHAGVEWGWWAGPTDCAAGAAGAAPQSVEDLGRSLGEVRIADCTAAAWRFLGLSLAGWNALVSLLLVGLAILGSLRR